jgi:5-methyltetrahydrofolate--homocysteine methyltransferase
MIVVGELINASRKQVAAAIESRNEAEIAKLAQDQFEAGADYIDVNAGIFVDREAEYLKWLVTTVQSAVEAPCCLDSPDPKAIEAALTVHKGTAMVNSISLEKERLEKLLPVVAGTDLKVVALCMSDEGMPTTADQRLAIAGKLITALEKKDISLENIYMDPLVQPISADHVFGQEFLKAIERLRSGFPGIHTICGLSNISYGLPERKFLNQTFMVMAITRGLDGAIINPLDKRMMAGIVAAEALAGQDQYCLNYIQAFREKKL